MIILQSRSHSAVFFFFIWIIALLNITLLSIRTWWALPSPPKALNAKDDSQYTIRNEVRDLVMLPSSFLQLLQSVGGYERTSRTLRNNFKKRSAARGWWQVAARCKVFAGGLFWTFFNNRKNETRTSLSRCCSILRHNFVQWSLTVKDTQEQHQWRIAVVRRGVVKDGRMQPTRKSWK